jgi:hypothetical protein
MSIILPRLSVLLAGIVISVLPVHSIAQSGESLEPGMPGDLRGHGREQRREEFLAKNPELAERIQQRKQEMESRRAEFETKYPDAAAEMQAWVENDRESRSQIREQMKSRRAEFETKYPEVVAEMKAMREQGREAKQARQAKMESRRAQFAEKYPDAAAELRSMQEDMGRRGGSFRRGPGKGFGRPHPDI